MFLMALLCLCGGGCCSINAYCFAPKHFSNDFYQVERTGIISKDSDYIVVNVSFEIIHRYLPKELLSWRTHSNRTYKLPLRYPLDGSEKFILDVEVDDNTETDSRTRSFSLNQKYVDDGKRYNNITDKPFLLKKYYTINNEDRYSSQIIHIKVHPNDMPELYKPFVTYTDNCYHNGKYMRWREDLMIPYKRDGNRFHIYSAANRHFNHVLVERGPYVDMDLNPATLLCWAIIMPPAFVIDVVTLPFQAAGCVIFAIGLSSLGP